MANDGCKSSPMTKAMEEEWRGIVERQWLRDCMEEWRDWGHLVVRAKWTMDGAATLAEAAARFRERADEMNRLAKAGFELDQPVDGDYGYLVRPGEDSPMRLVEDDEDDE